MQRKGRWQDVCVSGRKILYVDLWGGGSLNEGLDERLRRVAQIPYARSTGGLTFVQCRLMFMGRQYETCFVSPLWRLLF